MYNIFVMGEFLDKYSWEIAILMVLSLGLAPYKPPHIWEKLLMLSQGALKRPIDWFDLVLHATPWVLLLMKIIHSLRSGGQS